MDSRLKMSGMTEEGLNNVGNDGRGIEGVGHDRREFNQGVPARILFLRGISAL